MNCKRQLKAKLGHVVQIRVCSFDVNVKLDLSIIQIRDLKELTTRLTLGNRIVSTGFQTQLACFR